MESEMGLIETLLSLLLREGGATAIKRINLELDKQGDFERRRSKKQLVDEIGSVITRSIIAGDSTLTDPLRPLIAEFRLLVQQGVSVENLGNITHLIEQKEIQDAVSRRGVRMRTNDVMFSRAGDVGDAELMAHKARREKAMLGVPPTESPKNRVVAKKSPARKTPAKKVAKAGSEKKVTARRRKEGQ
jgi:hypothetical protein